MPHIKILNSEKCVWSTVKYTKLCSQINCTMTPLFKSTSLMHHKDGFHAGSCLHIDVHNLYFGTKWHPWCLAALTTTSQVLIGYLDLHVSDQPLQHHIQFLASSGYIWKKAQGVNHNWALLYKNNADCISQHIYKRRGVLTKLTGGKLYLQDTRGGWQSEELHLWPCYQSQRLGQNSL